MKPTILSKLFYITISLLLSGCTKHPHCSDTDAWPTGMAYTHLKNAHIIEPENLDWERTITTRIASQKIGNDLYIQVHMIKFFTKDGESFTTIAVNEASNIECSMSNIDLYIISKILGSYSNK